LRPYELVVVLHPDLEIDVDAPVSKIEKLVDAAGGKVIKRDNWGKKRLAYRINKQDYAVYVYFELSMDPSKVRQLENNVLLTEEVMRHLLVAHEENRPAPAKAKKAKAKTEEPELTAVNEDK